MRALVKVYLAGGPIGTEHVAPGVYDEPFPFLLEKEVAHMTRLGVTESALVDVLVDVPSSVEAPADKDEEVVEEKTEEVPVVRKASK